MSSGVLRGSSALPFTVGPFDLDASAALSAQCVLWGVLLGSKSCSWVELSASALLFPARNVSCSWLPVGLC